MKAMKQTGRGSVTPRLVISGLVLGGSLLLSAMAFYYYHTTAPLIPLLVGLIGVVPMGRPYPSFYRVRPSTEPVVTKSPPDRSTTKPG